MSDTVQIDSEQVDKFLDTLADDEFRNRVLFNAVKAGGQVLRKNTEESLKRKWGENAYSAIQGIRMKGNKSYNEAKVYLLSDYKLWWFEMGTKERHTRGHKITGEEYVGKRKYLTRSGKGHRTGRIKPLYFFKAAREGSESAITEAIIKSIDTAIKRVYKL